MATEDEHENIYRSLFRVCVLFKTISVFLIIAGAFVYLHGLIVSDVIEYPSFLRDPQTWGYYSLVTGGIFGFCVYCVKKYTKFDKIYTSHVPQHNNQDARVEELTAEIDAIRSLLVTARSKAAGELIEADSKIIEIVPRLIEELEDARQRIDELEVQLEAARQRSQPASLDSEQGKVDTERWQESVAAVCRATIEVCQGGRTDWTSGQDTADPADSAGDETFNALLSRMYQGKNQVLALAERAAWKVLSEKGFTWKVGRKPAKLKS